MVQNNRSGPARDLVTKELERAKAANDIKAQAWMEYALSRGYANARQPARSTAYLRQAEEHAKTAKQTQLEGLILLSRAGFQRVGQARGIDSALAQQALAKLEESESYRLASFVILELAKREKSRARKEELIEQGLARARQSGNRRAEGQQLLTFGNMLIDEGNAAAALDKFRAAAEVFAEYRFPRMLADAYRNIGEVYRYHGSHREALEQYKKALELTGKMNAPVTTGNILQGMGISYYRLGQNKEALDHLERALALAKRSGNLLALTARVTSLAVTLADMGEAEKAHAWLEELKQRRPGVTNPHLLWAQAYVLFQLHRYPEAYVAADAGVAKAREEGKVEPLLKSLGVRALAGYQVGKKDEAIADLLQALGQIEQLRANLVSADYMKRGFGESYKRFAEEVIPWLFEAKRPSEALEIAEKARARAFLDLLAARRSGDAELLEGEDSDEQSLFALPEAEEITSNVQAQPASLPQIMETARQLRSTVVSYWVGEKAVMMWVINAKGVAGSLMRPLDQKRLAQLIQQARSAKQDPKRTAWRELHRHLVAPIQPWLPVTEGARLTLVLHGPLFQLPFAALVDANGKYLIERYETHVLPAVAVLDWTKAAATQQRYLLVGDPVRTKLPPLPGSKQEVSRVGALLPKGTVQMLTGSQADLAHVSPALANRTVLHFATHAVVDSTDPMRSFLALSNETRLTAADIYELELTANLAVLSACRSASGEITSDGVMGLTRAFFTAGVSSVVASVWDAADQTTAPLLEAFYRYRTGSNNGTALRKAQLQVLTHLRSGTMEVQTPAGPAVIAESPLLWAPLQLQGRP